MSDVTLITDMTLPDEVVEKARETYHAEGMSLDAMQAAIRAALQAMLDNGMARVGGTGVSITNGKWSFGDKIPQNADAVLIRLNGKPKDQL